MKEFRIVWKHKANKCANTAFVNAYSTDDAKNFLLDNLERTKAIVKDDVTIFSIEEAPKVPFGVLSKIVGEKKTFRGGR